MLSFQNVQVCTFLLDMLAVTSHSSPAKRRNICKTMKPDLIMCGLESLIVHIIMNSHRVGPL